jgi:ABC-type polysaccharide/polyol phosphate export permease
LTSLAKHGKVPLLAVGATLMFVQLWTHRVMIAGLVRRDLRARYAGSVLGMAWTVLQPLSLFLVYMFVFSTILQVKFTPEDGPGVFAFYLLAGLLPWLGFQEGVTKAATAVVDNAGLVKAMRFPAAVLVVSSVAASLVAFLLSFVLLLIALFVTDRLTWASLPLVPVLVCLQTALALGCGLIVAGVQTVLRDTVQVLQMIFMVWFYLTPIIYPLSYVPSRFAALWQWNPFTPIVSSYRTLLLEGQLPALADFGPSCAWAAVALLSGCWLFSRLEPGFADLL